MTLEKCYRVSKCFRSGPQDVPVKKIAFFPERDVDDSFLRVIG